MSDLDIDNASLPSDEGPSQSAPTQSRTRLPYGTLRIQEEDEPVSLSKALRDIRSSGGRHHILDLSHAYLGDEKIEKLLEELRPRSEAADLHDNASPAATQIDWTRLAAPLSRLAQPHPRQPFENFRVIELDGNELTSDCLPALCKFLTGNLTLHTLSLKGNDIDAGPNQISVFAKALGQSVLRKLLLSSNPITYASVAAFFDSIPASGTALECLEMSNLLIDDVDDAKTAEEQSLIAAQAVSRFIADSDRCRSLQTLNLYGNGFGIRGVRAIVAALCGFNLLGDWHFADPRYREIRSDPFYKAILRAKLGQPNRSLEEVGLSGNVERGWLQQDAEQELQRLESIRKRYASIPVPDLEAILTFLASKAQAEAGITSDAADGQAPIEVLRHLPTIDIPLEEWGRDFDEVAEIGAGINASTWKSIKQQHLDDNMNDGHACRKAALRILGAARMVGCRASRATLPPQGGSAKEAPGFHRFLDLPPELRLLVLRHLDTENVLSARQFSSVISYACDASTIGYGNASFDWSRVLNSQDSATPASEGNASSTLPAEKWSWTDCFARRAPPRDWDADRLDASDYPDTARARGITMKWGYPPSCTGLYAFLESTLTQRAEL